MIYDPDDMIGMGNGKAVVARLRKGAARIRKLVQKVRGRVQAARGTGGSAETVTMPVDRAVVPAANNPMAFIQKNPIAIAGIGLVAVLLLTMKKRGR